MRSVEVRRSERRWRWRPILGLGEGTDEASAWGLPLLWWLDRLKGLELWRWRIWTGGAQILVGGERERERGGTGREVGQGGREGGGREQHWERADRPGRQTGRCSTSATEKGRREGRWRIGRGGGGSGRGGRRTGGGGAGRCSTSARERGPGGGYHCDQPSA